MFAPNQRRAEKKQIGMAEIARIALANQKNIPGLPHLGEPAEGGNSLGREAETPLVVHRLKGTVMIFPFPILGLELREESPLGGEGSDILIHQVLGKKTRVVLHDDGSVGEASGNTLFLEILN